MNGFGPYSESLTGTFLIPEDFCQAQTISHQGSIATMGFDGAKPATERKSPALRRSSTPQRKRGRKTASISGS